MAKKNVVDVIEMVSDFQKTILSNKPTQARMYEEIQMMQFKIRPLQGDISLLNLKNAQFIEILWSLGKLDEFFQDTFGGLRSKKRQLFLRLFEELHDTFQDRLNALSLKPEHSLDSAGTFEMEIYKERTFKHN